jgi:N-acetylmuramoyl-L-alanine amidase
MKKRITAIILAGLLSFSGILPASTVPAKAAEKPVVIVIDPGHGGNNLGAQHNGFTEKLLTLQVANAMKAELEKYDNVTVYLTRTSNEQGVSLEDRAAFAQSVNADFLYSLHFNASAEHNFYGCEVWASAFGSCYQKGMDFGNIMNAELGSLDIYQKGVKTKIGKKGEDYYGVIRACTARNIPGVIIEHAYLDHAYDVPKVKAANFLNTLGVKDATAVAKYFKLKSSKTGADFSGFKYTPTAQPAGPIRQDESAPDVCDIKVLARNDKDGNVLVQMTAKDNQSPVIYFAYSYDGGKTYSPLQMWDRSKETQSYNVKVPSGFANPTIVCRAYNNFELFKESNPVPVKEFKY